MVKALEEEKQRQAEAEKSDIQKQIEAEKAELEKLKKEKEVLLQDKEFGYIKEPPKQGDKNNIVLPIIFVILSVGIMIFSLYIREEGDSYVTSGISLGVNLVIFILSIVFMLKKKYTSSTKWLFTISLIAAIGMMIASVIGILGGIPGSK